MASIPARPTKLWWLIGLVLLCLCLVVQLPARWIVQKFAPNNPYLQQISGNLWQGQANWQVMTQPNAPLTGTLNWQWQPWYLFIGKLGFATEIRSGKTTLTGVTKVGKSNWQLVDFSGSLTSDTLKQGVNWQLPDAPIKVADLNISHAKQGFQSATGTLNWAGGELGYPSGGRVYKITMPSMVGTLSVDKASGQGNANDNGNNGASNGGQRLHLAMTMPQGQRLGDLYLDNDNMVDVALTQRLLKNMPEYKGQGADDSVVVSIRQPLAGMR